MARVKTFTNGGKLFPGDLNSIEDDYEAAFSLYRTLLVGTSRAVATDITGATKGLLVVGDLAITSPSPTSAGFQGAPWHFDPADVAAAGRTAKLRLSASIITNAVAPGITMTVGLYPVTPSYGSSGSFTTWTYGTVVAGSTLAPAPGANANASATSGDFTAPAAGFYVAAVAFSGALAAGAAVEFAWQLQFRQV
jgi:hypothetical protein